MHYLLEEFLPPYYYSDWYFALKELLEACRIIRFCALTQTPRKIFTDTLNDLKV
jgi:hypothetical protein